MTRPRRIDLPFCLYHVMSRTNSGDIAFKDSKSKSRFLHYLSKYLDLFEFKLHAYCLMDNHFHLLLESGDRADLSEFMRRLLTAYTVYYNKRNHRHGHLFQGRFKSFVVDKAEYLITLSRYIHLNPHGIHDEIEDTFHYFGSSLKYYRHGNEPDFLHTGEVLSWFEGDRKKYEHYIREGLEEGDLVEIYRQRFIGGQAFSTRMMERMKLDEETDGTSSYSEKVRKRCLEKDEEKARGIVQKVAEYYNLTPQMIITGRRARGVTGKARIVLICLLRDNLPWTERQIGQFVGFKKGLYKYQHKMKSNKGLKKDYENLLRRL